MGVSRAAARRARPCAPSDAAHAGARGLGRHRGPADRHLPARLARWLEPHWPHYGEALPARLRPAFAFSRRRSGQVLRDRGVTEALRVLQPGILTTIQD